MTHTHTCGGCTNTWTGMAQAHCSVCHETFGGISSFDRHRLDGACRHPSEIGLAIGARGVWSEPFSWQREDTDGPAEKVMSAFRNAPPWLRANTPRPPLPETETVTTSSIYVDPASSKTTIAPTEARRHQPDNLGDYSDPQPYMGDPPTNTDTWQRGNHVPDNDYLNVYDDDPNDGWTPPL